MGFTKRLKSLVSRAGAGRPSPVFLVSFPRSGSNFVQNVVAGSSGRSAPALYDPFDPDAVLVKTHAPSYGHLRAEIDRLWPQVVSSCRFIVLWRDPRDVMISLYEWLADRRGLPFAQAEFLHRADYYRAVLGFARLSVLDAFRLFVRSWSDSPQETWDKDWLPRHFLTVRYERLLAEPADGFAEIFEFLGLSCQLDPAALAKLDALGSSKRSKRAVAHGWREQPEAYRELLEVVHRELAPELHQLGYGGTGQPERR